MLSSLSSGVSGLESFQEQMDVIGNNIANLNTTAFKAGTVNFADTFSNTLQTSGPSTSGQVGTGVEISSISSNWNEGSLSSTGIASNLAISGNGFFEVVDSSTSTPATYLTQDGSFTVNNAGFLVTAGGDFVQGYTTYDTTTDTGSSLGNIKIVSPTAGNPIASYSINSQGVISMVLADGTSAAAGQVLVTNVTDPQMLVNQGDNLYSNQEAANDGTAPTLAVAGTSGLGNIKSGTLESSNVDLSSEMANLISAQQAFDANSKMITTSNEILQTVVNMKQS
jgi:flagellar hook protein FlgE